MDSIFSYKRSDEDNYYLLLGCDETASSADFKKILKAKEVLSDPEKRIVYDKWYRSGICIPFENYLNLNKATHSSVHWVSKKKKDLMLDDGCCYSQDARIGECASSENVCKNNAWERDPACDLLKKFRNYEI